jgi:predicted DCC family thiol-disulfide oxidoreductase YuxK
MTVVASHEMRPGMPQTQKQMVPILLFNDECGVCRHIGHWVEKSAQSNLGKLTLIVRPIGDDPEVLRALNPALNIWDAYETIHLLMPDGSMKLGGEAVAQVLRNLPNSRWFAWSFGFRIFGFRPFQLLLNVAYAILSDVRPIFGCESCGTPSYWVRPIHGMAKWMKHMFGESRRPSPSPHFTSLASGRHSLPGTSERGPQAPSSGSTAA